MLAKPQTLSVEDQLLETLASLAKKPYNFVMWAFPWGEEGTELEGQTGPDVWQREALLDLQAKLESGYCDTIGAIKLARRSGHGVGKSAFVSWVIWWAMSTSVGCRGRVTAATKDQLQKTLWTEVAKWHRLFIAKAMFHVSATGVFSADRAHEREWHIDAIPWSKENPQAFAGLHNYGKRIIIIFDEASAIDDSIWEVVEGATTDANTEIIWLATGNPTLNYGRFKECFDSDSDWFCARVNAEEVKISNKAQQREWERRHGRDSDFYKVRVLGEFPNSSEFQLIPIETIIAARNAPILSNPFEPLLLAVDIARSPTGDENVACFRRGKDARSIPAERWKGLTLVETAQRIGGLINKHEPDGTFIDGGGVGGGVVDILRSLGFPVIDVQFGAKASTAPSGIKVANKRAEMYVALREWMREAGAIENHDDLQSQLVTIISKFKENTGEIILMSKEDMRSLGLDSPDWADALAMTFAYPVAKKSWNRASKLVSEYDPFSEKALKEGVV